MFFSHHNLVSRSEGKAISSGHIRNEEEGVSKGKTEILLPYFNEASSTASKVVDGKLTYQMQIQNEDYEKEIKTIKQY